MMSEDVESMPSDDLTQAGPPPINQGGTGSLENKLLPELTNPSMGDASPIIDEDDSDQSENTDEDVDKGSLLQGAYDPAEFEDLQVSAEIKDLFQYITRYTPQNIELDTKLKPFIPEYIPAVGDIDAFIKVTRPDGKNDTLGFTVLDEPSGKQSDPTVLDLQLRALAKTTASRAVAVKMIKNAEKNGKPIDKWIKDISDLHRSKPPPSVHYSKRMPDIDTLMQEWPSRFEELLKDTGLPTGDIDADLHKYVEILCSLLDIPVYKSSGSKAKGYIQALHVMFTLYSAFKTSQHFQQMDQDSDLPDQLLL